jgi:hypothetical protein
MKFGMLCMAKSSSVQVKHAINGDGIKISSKKVIYAGMNYAVCESQSVWPTLLSLSIPQES